VLSQGSAGSDQERASAAIEPPRILLVPFSFWLARDDDAAPPDPAASTSAQSGSPDPTALRGAIAAHLAGLGWAYAEPLRWAITAVDPLLGLQLEGVGVIQAQESR
jgi:hypothetical protein